MGKRNKHRSRRPQKIPNLDNPDDCRDWLDRNEARVREVHQWDIWFARLGRHPYSSVQEGERPVLIVSNDKNNRFANTVTVVPFTTKMKKLDMPTHVVVGEDPAWKNGKASMALVEQMTTIDKRRLVNREGAVSRPETIEQLKTAVLMQLGLEDSDETQ